MCCGIYVHSMNGKLAKKKKRYYGSCSFWYYNQKKHHLDSCAKKRLRRHRHINAFFGLKMVVNQKSVNLGMISARHTTNRQSLKKVTCPFNLILTCASALVQTTHGHKRRG